MNVELSQVLQAETLEVDDVVITTGADEIYPEGLVVGQVVSLTGKPSDVTKGGEVELLGDFESEVWVY